MLCATKNRSGRVPKYEETLTFPLDFPQQCCIQFNRWKEKFQFQSLSQIEKPVWFEILSLDGGMSETETKNSDFFKFLPHTTHVCELLIDIPWKKRKRA